MSSPVSLQDIAKAAGVEKSTVSRVLSGKGSQGRISPTTQARIRSIAAQLGYVRKPAPLFRKAIVIKPVPKATVVSPPLTPELSVATPPTVEPVSEPVPPSTPEPPPSPEMETRPR